MASTSHLRSKSIAKGNLALICQALAGRGGGCGGLGAPRAGETSKCGHVGWALQLLVLAMAHECGSPLSLGGQFPEAAGYPGRTEGTLSTVYSWLGKALHGHVILKNLALSRPWAFPLVKSSTTL